MEPRGEYRANYSFAFYYRIPVCTVDSQIFVVYFLETKYIKALAEKPTKMATEFVDFVFNILSMSVGTVVTVVRLLTGKGMVGWPWNPLG
ncbi:hypothetical protein EPI10_022054 [Gossypium australe]|uniref:Uncharacterized protein n=1 Tax=Gossypium australe TaxID=47621 RepID=A0A5B6WLJ0_9ROSI|nr:hypothetical protein EPI10_022054 [Gossypium australe]